MNKIRRCIIFEVRSRTLEVVLGVLGGVFGLFGE